MKWQGTSKKYNERKLLIKFRKPNSELKPEDKNLVGGQSFVPIQPQSL